MTKLKGTILLGEGYNRTKAVFDCNLPQIESNVNLGEIEKLQLQINNIKDTLEYNELDVDYSKVPFTIEFLEDGYFSVFPGHETAHIEYSTDGGITWEDGELINPLQLAINHNLLLDESFFSSWLGIPVEAGDLICLRGLGLFYQEMSGDSIETSLRFITDAKYHIFGNITTLFFDAFRDIDIEFLYNTLVVPVEKSYLNEYPDKVNFWNACSKEEKIGEIFFSVMLKTSVLEFIDIGVPIEEVLKYILMSGSSRNIIFGTSPGWANISSIKQLWDYVYWTMCILVPSSNPLAGISKLLFQELVKLAAIEANKNSQDIFYTEELVLLLIMPLRGTLIPNSFNVTLGTEPFPLDDLFYNAPNLISIKNLYLQELFSYLIPNLAWVTASMEGHDFVASNNYNNAFSNNKSLLDGSCIFHSGYHTKADGTGNIRIMTSYANMFKGCTALRVAPKDLTAGLGKSDMFSGCTNLNYIKFTATNIEDYYLANWVKGVSPTGTFVKAKDVEIPIGPNGIPEGWTIEEYISPEDHIKELKKLLDSIDSNTEEIDILKNRIISTTYSELKDAVTNSTLTTGQYYRITDYVTTCNGTSAKVTDASTIDPENPVDGQSRSAGHQFDIVVRALSPNQLDENAVAVCNASETYYDSTFNGTVIKYSIENKYWSTEDGKGTIYYMKDHNDNECSYDFTNIEYYYAESTTWYLTFNKDSSKVVILNTNTVLPFVIIYGHVESPNSISITGSLLEIYMYAGAINAVDIKGTINNFKVIAPTNKMAHTINITGRYETVLLLALGLISTITFSGYFQNVSIESGKDLAFFTIYGLHLNFTIKSAPEQNCLRFFMLGLSLDSSIDASEIPAVPSDFTCFGYLYKTIIKAVVSRVTICGTLQNSTIKAKGLSKVVFLGTNKNLVIDNNNNNITSSSWKSNSNITILGGTHALSFLYFGDSVLGITILSYSGLTPSYITFKHRVYNITIEGGVQNVTLTNVACNLHLKSTEEAAFAADITVNGVRGVSADSLLEIPLHSVKGGCKKDIYRDASGRIFYTWEDNLVKKGYYINDNTDTEWKEIPTSEKSEVPTIPDAVTTALSVATLDLTTRTTIATIAGDETLAFTLVPAIQGEYRLVVVNSSDVDITVTMPTEENYQCLCGATLTIPAQTNIELIINVTDTLIYIRKG